MHEQNNVFFPLTDIYCRQSPISNAIIWNIVYHVKVIYMSLKSGYYLLIILCHFSHIIIYLYKVRPDLLSIVNISAPKLMCK